MKEKENITKKQSFIRIIGKCFIWLFILFLITLFISLLKMGNILLGFLPTTLCYIVSLYLCKKSGEIWDEYYYKKLEKKIKKSDIKSNTELATVTVTETSEAISDNARYTPPQENNTETTQTENTIPLSYKDRKKAARRIYKEQKRLLKEAHKKPTPRSFKITTIVLCVVLCFSLIANILLAVYVSELENDVAKEKASKEYYQDQHNDLTEYTNNLLSKHKQIKDELEDYQEIIYKYYNNIPLTKYEEHRARIAAFWGAEENQ